MAASTTPSSLSFFSSSIFLSSANQNSKLFCNWKPNSFKPQSKPLSISSQLATLPVLSFTGEKVGETVLDLKSAPPETARAVVHRAIITDQQNKRRGTASTLTRAEVSGGGRKPYQQKKTGKARRGSMRTPLRPGGGVVFGPKPRDWSIKINRKEKRLAISTAVASAAVNTIVVEDFGDKFEKPKTKEFIAALKRWGIDPKEKSLFLMTEVSDNVRLSSRNIGTLKLLTPRTLNLFDILNSDKLVLTPAAVDYLNERYGINYEEGIEDEEEEEEEELEGEEGLEAGEELDAAE
ncbi:50S ribosomal protein L4, chloroplastic-like [Cucurbita pepo subsp. pepo]|uniref:50S ribosomal protein L4, chloroplastic-like n=1 Tax=Cucurbita pepo subsp. pepo TaxID=3664 RepID=UPI000C9DA492|nr:50S ribosomal protein L4, chloroplastic-like [Cucurbita pepo subsp. pepo]